MSDFKPITPSGSTRSIVIERTASFSIRQIVEVPSNLSDADIQSALDDEANLHDALTDFFKISDYDPFSDEFHIVRANPTEKATECPDIPIDLIEDELIADELITDPVV